MTRFKRITEYSTMDLKDGINEAITACHAVGLDFHKVLKGIDCYFEQRTRKLALEAMNASQPAEPPTNVKP